MKRAAKPKRTAGYPAVTFDTVREIARALPGAVEGLSYGTPAFRAGKRLFVRVHDEGHSLVVKIDPEERAMRMRAEPETFHITEHYRNYPWVLVRLSTVRPDDLRDLLEDAWRLSAPPRLLTAHESGRRRSAGSAGARTRGAPKDPDA
jgi:hypothetical protein